MSTRAIQAIENLASAVRALMQGNVDGAEIHALISRAENLAQEDKQEIEALKLRMQDSDAAEAAADQTLNQAIVDGLAAVNQRIDGLAQPIAGVSDSVTAAAFQALSTKVDDIDGRVKTLEGEDPGDLGLGSGGPGTVPGTGIVSTEQTAAGEVHTLENGAKTDASGAAIDPSTGQPATGSAGQSAAPGGPTDEQVEAAAAAAPADAPAADGGATAVVSTDPAHGATDGQPVIITQDDAGNVLTTPVVSGDVPPSSVSVDGEGVPTVTADPAAAAPVLGETTDAPEGTPAPADPAHVDNPAVTDVSAPAPVDAAAPPVTDAAVVSDDPAHHPDGADAAGPAIITADPATGDVFSTPVVSGEVTPGSVVVAQDGTPSINPDVNTGDMPVLGDTVAAPDGTPAPQDIADATPVAQPPAGDAQV